MKFANYMSFSSDLNQHGLEYAVKHTADLGFDAVEFLANHAAQKPFSNLAEACEAKKVLEHYGLSVSCYSIGWDLVSQEVDGLLRHAELAHAVGAPMFHHTLFPPLSINADSPKYDDVFEPVLEKAERMANFCKPLDITCLYEPQGMYFNGTKGLGRFFDVLKERCSNIGVCGDTATSLFVDVDPLEIFKRFSNDIKHLHIHNYAIFDTETQFRSRGGKWLGDVDLTDGIVDLKACLSQLTDYHGMISIEMVTDDETLKNAIRHIRSIF